MYKERVVKRQLVVIVALALSCRSNPPRGQLVLYIDTDAPVPLRYSTQDDPLRPAPLFDRMRVEIFEPAAATPCDSCTNEFAVDRDSFMDNRVSFGVVVANPRQGFRARVRLFPNRFVAEGAAPASVTIDRWVALPMQLEDVVTTSHVLISVDDVGQPADSSAPLIAQPGAPPASLVGSWSGAVRSKCKASPKPDRVCVPGGAFWLGSVDTLPAVGHSSDWHRLATLSPYWLDSHEMTVSEFRTTGAIAKANWTGLNNGDTFADWCTVAESPDPSRDKLPVNCVTQTQAKLACASRGGDLETVAQFAYVATGLGVAPYIWGFDIPSCADAIWSRAGAGIYAYGVARGCLSTSVALGPLGGPEPFGTALRDRLTLFGAELVDMNGNLAEHARDSYAAETDACLQPAILTNPICLGGSSTTFVGGDWLGTSTDLRGDHRGLAPTDSFDVNVGFRCAYRDQ